jgi:hypothetical protein
VEDRLKVIVVGGSPTAAQLVADFMARPFVDIVGIADPDPAGNVADSAIRFGIPFATRIDELGAEDMAADLVIDIGSASLDGPAPTCVLPSRAEGGPAVVSGSVARLMLDLAADSGPMLTVDGIRRVVN